MRLLLVVAILAAFVVVPGVILAFHSAHADLAAEELLNYIDGPGLTSIDCRAGAPRLAEI